MRRNLPLGCFIWLDNWLPSLEGLSLDDIAARFEVSRRTAERMRAVIDKKHRAPFCCGDRSAASIRQSRSGRNKRQPSRSNRLE